MDYFLIIISSLIILFVGLVSGDNRTKIGQNEFIKSAIQSDNCDSKRYPCKNERDNGDNYLMNSKKVGWIAKPLMEALWAFSPDPSSNKTSEICSRHVRIYQEHLKNNYLWATQMLDASTLTPGGILSGDNYQLGHFDQCLDVNFDIGNNIDTIKGQYCLARIILDPSYDAFPQYYRDDFVEFPYDLQYNPVLSSWTKMKLTVDRSKKQRNKIYWSVCVPSSCSVDEIETALKEQIVPVLRKKGIHASITLDKKLCQVKSEANFTMGSFVFILFGVLSLTLVFIFSLIDIIFYRNSKWMYSENNKKGKLESVMLSFSVYQNFVNLNKPDHSEDLDVMHGMRTYTTVLVMLGHRFMFTYGSPFHNPEFLEHRYRSFDEIFVLNGFLIVDTFFVLSGFLTCYLLLIHLKKNGTFNLTLIYLHRLVRILPLYTIILSIYTNILPLIGDGPIWSLKAGVEIERCRKSWWTNILFINNYVDADICMFQSWFLTCDMHFFIFGPILAFLLHKRPKLGVFVTTSLLLTSIALSFLVTYTKNLDGVVKVYMSVVEDPMTNDYVKNIYIKSHNRAGPYIVGILAAYLYFVLKRKNFKFSLFQVRFGTTICAIVALGSLLSAWVFYIPGRKYNVIENALYSSLHRITWSCAMCWIIIVGGTAGFGIVGPVLNLKSLVPFSRLTYAVFLIHGLVQLYSVATIRTPEYIRFPKLFWMWSGDVTVSFVLALILHLLFEAPLNGLLKIIVSSFLQRGKSELPTAKDLSNEKNVKQNANMNSTTVLHKRMNGTKKRNSKGKANISTLSDNILPKVENKHL